MTFRLSSYMLALLCAAGIGWSLREWPGALVGVALGGMLWVLIDLRRGMRFVEWMRTGGLERPPAMGGLWGEACDRAGRTIRLKDQQAMEHETRLSEFLAAIQGSPNGVVLLGPDDSIEWCNQTAADHFGLDPARDYRQLIGYIVRDPAFTSYNASQHYEHEVFMPGRQDLPGRPVKLAVRIHAYAKGRKLLLSRDVTAVAQAEAMRRDFVANVSHEIRTPLTVLAGFIETMQSVPLDAAEQARYLDLMSTQAHRMTTLVNDLLTLSRLEGSPPPGTTDWTPLAELVSHAEEEGRGLSRVLHGETQGVEQQFVFDAPPPVMLGGSLTEIRSAISNLISNAVRYTPAGGSIRASWQYLPDGRLEFSVTDSGPGIAKEHLPRLSERFYRVDRSRSRETGGTGLGLAITKHVMQRHGGELSMSSELGKGARFSLIFPVARLRVGVLSD